MLSSQTKPGLYMIQCLLNDFRYYGETSNLSLRLSSHKSRLRRNIHSNQKLQGDWNLYGEASFSFTLLYRGNDWIDRKVRQSLELKLIVENRSMCYNLFESFDNRIGKLNGFYKKKHSIKTKELMSFAKKSIPNDALGRKITIGKRAFPSISQASRDLGHSRKLIRLRLDSPDFPDWTDERKS